MYSEPVRTEAVAKEAKQTEVNANYKEEKKSGFQEVTVEIPHFLRRSR